MAEPKFTADELHKLHLGNLMVQVINLQAELEKAMAQLLDANSENERLRNALVKAGGSV